MKKLLTLKLEVRDHLSPGEDNIPAELIKATGHKLWTRLQRVERVI